VPQALKYKAKSIIYFEGDVSDKIFILQSGKVSLISTDIETGKENRELVKTGEFFGVKSSLGKFPREETADVILDSVVLIFTVPEFENLIYTNPRITVQMLKVFSNQLRRIHKQVGNLLSEVEQVDQEKGLFGIGEYYYKNQKFKQALYAFRRYLTYYPAGILQAKATEYMINIEKGTPVAVSSGSGASAGAAPAAVHSVTALSNMAKQDSDSSESQYFDGVTLFSSEKFEEAITCFRQYVSANPDGEYVIKALSDIGKAMYLLKKTDECIKHFTSMIQKFPKSTDIGEFLLYLGLSYEAKGDKAKAESFYKKVVELSEEGSETKRKAKAKLKAFGGK